MSCNWGRTLVAMVTPLNAAGELDLNVATALARDLVAQGSDAIILAGTTGEAATLTPAEKLRLFAAVSAELAEPHRVIAGIGGNCTRDTVKLVQAAEALPLGGYMAITPYYNKPNRAGLLSHYQAIDAASSRPIMVYNVPSRTGLDLDQQHYRSLFAACPRLTAVKEASADLVKAAWLVEEFPQVDFFSGNDDLLLPLAALGFKGVVSVAANIVPSAIARLTALASQGDWSEARKLHARLLPLFAALFWETNPVPVKAALELMGWPVGDPRLPLAKLSSANRQRLSDLLQDYSQEGH